MTAFLLFTLYAPLASWGEICVGENRGSWDRPSRSAILGLLAAALGITRDHQGGHDVLDQSYGLAVRLDAAGASLIDYHTVQSTESEIRKSFGKDRPVTRRQLLSVGERQTIVSRRELRQDTLATAALWMMRDDARWSLATLKQALERPAFVLYAGRKANVFALPLAPTLSEAATLADAFAGRSVVRPGVDLSALKPHSSPWGREISHDPLPSGVENGLHQVRREIRRDTHPHRARWQFAERAVSIGLLPEVRRT